MRYLKLEPILHPGIIISSCILISILDSPVVLIHDNRWEPNLYLQIIWLFPSCDQYYCSTPVTRL